MRAFLHVNPGLRPAGRNENQAAPLRSDTRSASKEDVFGGLAATLTNEYERKMPMKKKKHLSRIAAFLLIFTMVFSLFPSAFAEEVAQSVSETEAVALEEPEDDLQPIGEDEEDQISEEAVHAAPEEQEETKSEEQRDETVEINAENSESAAADTDFTDDDEISFESAQETADDTVSQADEPTLNGSILTMKVGQVFEITASGEAGSDNSWTTSDPTIAMIKSTDGNNCTIEGLSAGTATVTHSWTENGATQTATYSVVVGPGTDEEDLPGTKTAVYLGDDEYQITLDYSGKTGVKRVTREYILVLDQSGSMNFVGSGSTQYPDNENNRLNILKQALIGRKGTTGSGEASSGSFVNQVFAKYPDTTTFSLITFDSTASQIVTASNSNKVISEKINAVTATGGTNYQAALELAKERVENSTADQRIVIFLSDGKPTFYGNGVLAAGSSCTYTNFQKTIEAINALNTTLAANTKDGTICSAYPIAFNTTPSVSVRDIPRGTAGYTVNGITYPISRTNNYSGTGPFNFLQYIGAENAMENGKPKTNTVLEANDKSLQSILDKLVTPTIAVEDAYIADQINTTYFKATGTDLKNSDLTVSLVDTNAATTTSLTEGTGEGQYSVGEWDGKSLEEALKVTYNGTLQAGQKLQVSFKVKLKKEAYQAMFEQNSGSVELPTNTMAVGSGKFNNEQLGDFHYRNQPHVVVGAQAPLNKVDAKTGEALSGAKFKLTWTSKDGLLTAVRDVTVDSSGKVDLTSLPPGTYKLQETEAPTGYEKDETDYTFTVTSQDAQDEGENPVKRVVTLNKEITPPDKNLSFDSNGNLVFKNKVKTYQLTVSKVLKGTAVNPNDTFTFTFNSDKEVTQASEGSSEKVSLTSQNNEGTYVHSFILKGGEKIVLDVPYGTNITNLMETDPNKGNYSYTPSWTLGSQSSESGVTIGSNTVKIESIEADQELICTNVLDAQPVTGNRNSTLPYLGIGAVAGGILLGVFLIKRRRRV